MFRGGCGENFCSLCSRRKHEIFHTFPSPGFPPIPHPSDVSASTYTLTVTRVAKVSFRLTTNLTAMPGYNELSDPRAAGTEREETRWNR
jgi:hypothetical protein